MKANHQILSNWLKRATSWITGQTIVVDGGQMLAG